MKAGLVFLFDHAEFSECAEHSDRPEVRSRSLKTSKDKPNMDTASYSKKQLHIDTIQSQTRAAVTHDGAIKPSSLSDLVKSLRAIMRGHSDRYAGGKMRTVRLVITPTVANEILAQCNKKNRTVRQNTVAALVRLLHEQRLPVSTIVLGLFDSLLLGDGQHRLLAIVESGCAAELDARVHVDAEAYDLDVLTVDTGSARTLADRLRIRGLVNVGDETWAQALVNAATKFDGTKPAKGKLTATEEVDYFERFADSIEWALTLPRHRLRGHGLAAVMRCHAKEPRITNQVVTAALDGADLKKGSPEHALHMREGEIAAARNDRQKADVIAVIMRLIYDAKKSGPTPYISKRSQRADATARIFTKCAQTQRAVAYFCGADAAARFREGV